MAHVSGPVGLTTTKWKKMASASVKNAMGPVAKVSSKDKLTKPTSMVEEMGEGSLEPGTEAPPAAQVGELL